MNKLWLILIPAVALAQPETILEKKIGGATMYVFPEGTVHGRVDFGRTITIRYFLRVMKGGKPRFILLDSSKARKVAPKITPNASGSQNWFGGFLVRSTTQHQLDITITRELAQKINDLPARNHLGEIEKTLSREANLNVVIGRTGTGYKIIGIWID